MACIPSSPYGPGVGEAHICPLESETEEAAGLVISQEPSSAQGRCWNFCVCTVRLQWLEWGHGEWRGFLFSSSLLEPSSSTSSPVVICPHSARQRNTFSPLLAWQTPHHPSGLSLDLDLLGRLLEPSLDWCGPHLFATSHPFPSPPQPLTLCGHRCELVCLSHEL